MTKVGAKYAVKVPDQLTMEQAASTLWQGYTAHAFACSSYPIKAGDKVLVHAAAGGVGSLITQIAKNTGTGCLRSDCSKFVLGNKHFCQN